MERLKYYTDIPTKYSYDTGVDDVVEEFYIPFLSEAKRYDRITGFFSSTSLALAARGIAGLIKNGGTMRIVCCPRLSSSDVQAIKESFNKKNEILESRMLDDLGNITDDFQHDHIKALGWMLARGYLQIKIALLSDENGLLDYKQMEASPIMHQKVGVLYDTDYNSLSFSGSNNESASGWLYNLEEFKVFKSWEAGQKNYYEADRNKFEAFWNNTHKGAEVINLSKAIEENLIHEGKDFDIESLALSKYREYKEKKYGLTTVTNTGKTKKKSLSLFFYQDEAVKTWVSCGRQILLEMVTGSGKTLTSIGCISELLKYEKNPLLIVIACPQSTLSIQWKSEIDSLDIPIDESIICDSSSVGWKKALQECIEKLSIGLYDNLVIYTTHATACSKDFIGILNDSSDIAKMFIGDEVHGMGSKEHRKGLLPIYEYRVGCSATPSRWYDESGTALINEYFGGNSFEFTIEDALTKFNPITNKHFLVNYYYHPRFISMTEEELEEYAKLSKSISRFGRNSDYEKIREFLLFKRANLEKNAKNKYLELERILDEIGNDISDTIIFVSDEQLEKVITILGRRRIDCHEYTQAQGTKPLSRYGEKSERDYIIQKFKEGEYKVLVAIKCLDEGIDIPSAKRAIIMASSTNPREYIQRIGRVIRQAEGKKTADLYDMIIRPDYSYFKDEQLEKFEKNIFKAELRRVNEISDNAINNVDTAIVIAKIWGEIS